MKLLLVAILASFVANANADEVVKTCKMTMQFPGESTLVREEIRIVKRGDDLMGKMSKVELGNIQNSPDLSVEIKEFLVRTDLRPDSVKKNLAEVLILETMENPAAAGFDLAKIRNVRTFQIGKVTSRDFLAIIEAKDIDGHELGSFVTGLYLKHSCDK